MQVPKSSRFRITLGWYILIKWETSLVPSMNYFLNFKPLIYCACLLRYTTKYKSSSAILNQFKLNFLPFQHKSQSLQPVVLFCRKPSLFVSYLCPLKLDTSVSGCLYFSFAPFWTYKPQYLISTFIRNVWFQIRLKPDTVVVQYQTGSSSTLKIWINLVRISVVYTSLFCAVFAYE